MTSVQKRAKAAVKALRVGGYISGGLADEVQAIIEKAIRDAVDDVLNVIDAKGAK